ncbi:unnamed protein product [Enterobius vermicularis]|uniref:Lipoprotein n=1 Tax=Enterobius vermicularis TaxID=51028 RepID=A0A0N4V705_ENTVE|nr:unnamed protein product [Enterobius vermicularis]
MREDKMIKKDKIFDSAHKRADACLDSCQGSTDVANRIRQSYASLKIVCVDQKTGRGSIWKSKGRVKEIREEDGGEKQKSDWAESFFD